MEDAALRGARIGASRRRTRRWGHGRRRERARPRLAHDVRVLDGELETSQAEVAFLKGLQPRAAPAPPRRAPPDERAGPLLDAATGVPRSVLKEMEISEELTRAQHRHDAHDRVQLRRAGRDRRRRQAAARRPRRRPAQRREAHAGVRSPGALPPRHARSRPDHPHDDEERIEALPVVAGGLQRAVLHAGCTGPTSTASTCTRRRDYQKRSRRFGAIAENESD